MKLISIEQAITQVEQGVHIPASHELINSGIYRNPEYHQQPFYKVELEWNKKGEAELDEEGLVSRYHIRAELDASTGRLLAFYRHDHRRVREQKEKEMDESTFEALYPHVLNWINKLSLHIDPQELRLVRKTVIGEEMFRLSFQRHYQGIAIRDYQALEIKLNHNYELIHLNCTWDDCVFTEQAGLIPEKEFRAAFGVDQLSLTYINLLKSNHPFYACREDIYNAVTGELVYSDQAVLQENIDLSTTEPQRNEKITVLRVPIFDADYDSLKLEDGVQEAEPYAPHSFFTLITEEEKLRARDIAVSYLKTHHAADPCKFAFIGRPGRDVVESMRGNQVVVEIQRVVNDIPITGAGIRLVIDHHTWEVKNVVDTLDFIREAKGLDMSKLQAATFLPAIAWEQMKDKLEFKLQYYFDENRPETAGKRAILTYALDCDWLCDACTGELLKMD
ncbi:hypothetical protein C2I18_28220 [Paenibacillus sp. PK3_47]|uniref:hypothetical protein n=1 Tax=Paenibacillus sp. PK3_47 TaxID=2072642 RepID=UPI00201E1EF3|nr:hypothetical protein [Paenibacillus sp. PK3_47]UQZ37082.1 hypothetical protein C2I18_28220 [Paenibacillus sp. PK3_47]